MGLLGRWAGVLLGLCVVGGCGAQREYAILMDVFAESEDALLAGTDVRVTVRDLRSTLRVESQTIPLDRAVPLDEPIRIGIELHGAGEFMVHVAARGAGGVFATTRCYTVTGVTRAQALLAGPLGELDRDGDTWAHVETCQDVGSEQEGCADQCPSEWGIDCLPEDPDVSPGAVEICADGIDQDCDGDDLQCEDGDGDHYPPCPQGAGDDVVCDCDDGDPDVNPAVQEDADPALCGNGVDEDCDGLDQQCDGDGDGFDGCAPEEPREDCDCDDANPDVNPRATETPGGECDGINNNCNGLIDEVESCLSDDLDGDGSTFEDDCNDCSAAMAPGSDAARCGNLLDEACELGGTDDGRPLPEGGDPCPEGDADGDGFVGVDAGGPDCDDAEPLAYPGAPDRCGDGEDFRCAGGDTSCDGDGDGDGYAAGSDCDDEDPDRSPAERDVCNGIDDDCDGIVDEDLDEGTGCVNLGEWTVIHYSSDLVHCGDCRSTCNPGCDGVLCRADACTDARCTCGPEDACAGGQDDFCCADGCKDLTADPGNCGTCGSDCPAPECEAPLCRDGACATGPAPDGQDCSGGRTCCGGDCIGECAPGETQPRPCGNCGTQTRSCGDDCLWRNFGSCQGQGECAPDETETQSCGNCGTETRTCDDDCSWRDWADCEDEGECSPSAQNRQVPCGDCGNQEQECDNSCRWVDVDDCDDRPARSCDDGDDCTTDDCDSNGMCDHTGCGGSTPLCCDTGCEECCDPTDCSGDPGRCNEWDCSQGSCEAVDVPDGTDPGDDCGGGDPICCAGACEACCNGDASPCTGNPSGRCTIWACDGSDNCVAVDADDGTDPYNECGGHSGDDCCDGNGNCRDNDGNENCG